jgi:hypothetical protein
MSADLWERPVEVTIDHGDHFRSIRDCRDALAFMMTSWPEGRLASVALARRICLKAVEGRATSAAAASAFKTAAEEAGLISGPGY